MSLEKTAKLIFKGDDQASKVLATLGGNISSFGSNIQGFTQPFTNLAETILKIQGAAATALGALGAFSIQAAGSFEGGMNEIKTLLDGRIHDFDQFDKDIRSFFDTTAQPIDDVLQAAYDAISLGIPPDAIDSFLHSADVLATAGGSTLNEAVNLLAGTANAYGASINEISGYADTFFIAVKDGKTTVPELAGAIGQVTSLAAPFGVSITDVTAAIAALTAYGVPSTEQAATILKSMIEGLVNPSDKAAKAAAGLGISLGADVFKNTTLQAVLQGIGEKTGFSAGKIQEMFTSSEALKGILPLMNDPANKFAQALADMADKLGIAENKYNEMVNNIDKINGRLVNSVQKILIDIGIPLLDDYKEAVGGLDGILDGLDLGLKQGSFDPVIKFFEDLLKEIGTLAGDIAKVLPEALGNVDSAGLVKSFEDIQEAVEDVFEAIFGEKIDLTSAEGLQKVLQTIVDGFAGLGTISAGIISQLPVVFEIVAGFVKSVSSADVETIANVGKVLGTLVVVSTAASGINAIGASLTAVSSGFKALAAVNVGAVSGLLAAAGPILGTAAAGGAAGFGIGTLINDQINKAVDALTGGKNDTFGGLVYDWIHGDGKLESGISAAENQLSRPIDKMENDLKPKTRDFLEEVKSKAGDFGKIEWNLDEDGNIAGTVKKLKSDIAKIDEDANFDNLVKKYMEMGNSEKIAVAMAKVGDFMAIPGKSATDSLLEAQTQTENFKLKLLDLASNETIRAMELTTEFKIAGLEEETKRAKDVLNTLDNTINSTQTLLGGLFDKLGTGGFNNSSTQKIQDQIDKENKIREQAAKDTHELTKLQIQSMELRNQRAREGGSDISISMEGIYPELEMIMWEVIKRVQVRLVEEEAAFLLLG